MNGFHGFSILAAAVVLSSSGLASAAFNCTSEDGLFGVDSLTVSVSGTGNDAKLTATFPGDGASESVSGTSGVGDFNPSYKSRARKIKNPDGSFRTVPGSKKVVQFTGFDGLIDESGSVDAIASKALLSATATKGFITLRWRGESYEAGFYTCAKAQ